MDIDRELVALKKRLSINTDALYGRAMLDHMGTVRKAKIKLMINEEITSSHVDRIWSYAKLIYKANREASL